MPPSTAPAIDVSVSRSPITGSPEPVCAAMKSPASAVRKPEAAKATIFTHSTRTPER